MSAVEQDDSLAIRAKPRPVKRFNKRVLIGASSIAALLILGAAAMALRTPDRAQEAHTELYNTRHKPMPDAFASLPESYGDMPSRLGPPLPGDLGAAMIGAPRIEDAPENPFRYQPARVASAGSGTGAPSAADEARASDLFFINNSAQGGRILTATSLRPSSVRASRTGQLRQDSRTRSIRISSSARKAFSAPKSMTGSTTRIACKRPSRPIRSWPERSFQRAW